MSQKIVHFADKHNKMNYFILKQYQTEIDLNEFYYEKNVIEVLNSTCKNLLP